MKDFQPISRKEMIDIIASEDYLRRRNCPFCRVERHQKNGSFLFASEYRYIVRNLSPYRGDAHHLLAVPKRHAEIRTDLTQEEWADYENIETYIKNWYGEETYFAFTRETFGGRSVGHFHTHFLPGTLRVGRKNVSWKADIPHSQILPKYSAILFENRRYQLLTTEMGKHLVLLCKDARHYPADMGEMFQKVQDFYGNGEYFSSVFFLGTPKEEMHFRSGYVVFDAEKEDFVYFQG